MSDRAEIQILQSRVRALTEKVAALEQSVGQPVYGWSLHQLLAMIWQKLSG
jgi:hypothetical protein